MTADELKAMNPQEALKHILSVVALKSIAKKRAEQAKEKEENKKPDSDNL